MLKGKRIHGMLFLFSLLSFPPSLLVNVILCSVIDTVTSIPFLWLSNCRVCVSGEHLTHNHMHRYVRHVNLFPERVILKKQPRKTNKLLVYLTPFFTFFLA